MKNIMKRAWEIYKNTGCATKYEFGLCLKMAWAESRQPKEYKNVTIATFDEYNFRRYSNPWVAVVDENGRLDFNKKVGTYTGRYNSGEAGDLYVFSPIEGQVYGFGQKDYRGNRTIVEYVMWMNGEFAKCDKIGRVA